MKKYERLFIVLATSTFGIPLIIKKELVQKLDLLYAFIYNIVPCNKIQYSFLFLNCFLKIL